MGCPFLFQEAISISEIFDYQRVLYNKPREIPHWLGPVRSMWHHKIAQELGLFINTSCLLHLSHVRRRNRNNKCSTGIMASHPTRPFSNFLTGPKTIDKGFSIIWCGFLTDLGLSIPCISVSNFKTLGTIPVKYSPRGYNNKNLHNPHRLCMRMESS
jgi:hypothetical protein